MKLVLFSLAALLTFPAASASAQATYSQQECDQIHENCRQQANAAGNDVAVYDSCMASYGAQECRTADGEPNTDGFPRQYFPGNPDGSPFGECNSARSRIC